MSQSSRSSEPITVERDGVSVTKRLLTDEFPVPTIEFELASTLDQPVEVVLREYIPDGFSLEAVGFHSEYGSDHWSAYQDSRIEYSRTIDPNEMVRTIYGLRLGDESEATAFMGEPELVSVQAVQAGGVQSGDADTSSSATATSTTTTDEPVETTIDIDDLPAGAIAEALASEFRAGEVDEEDREAIQEALDLDLSESAEARFRQLQSRVEDLIAYTDLIEEFLDEGGPKERFDEFDERITELSESMADLEESTPDGADLEELHDRIDELDAVVSDIEEWRGQLGEMFVKKEEQAE